MKENNDGTCNNNPYEKPPGRYLALACAIFGGISCALAWIVGWFLVWLCPAAILFGAAGTVLAVRSRKAGCSGGLVSAGLILSLAGVGGGVLILVSCASFMAWVSCVSCVLSSVNLY